jgi:N6-adenosine-specific RNA methylase IME4
MTSCASRSANCSAPTPRSRSGIRNTPDRCAGHRTRCAPGGFEPKTEGAWAKQSSTGRKWAFGQGKILRCAVEFYMVGTRGHPTLHSRSVRNLIVAPVREHSRKPDELYHDMEALYGGPYLELHARYPYPGWIQWGDQLAALTAA